MGCFFGQGVEVRAWLWIQVGFVRLSSPKFCGKREGLGNIGSEKEFKLPCYQVKSNLGLAF